jgi:hypothetical protein
MFKAPVVSLDQFRQEQKSAPLAATNDVFKVLHGFYGSLFLSKFSTGQLDDKNRDMGIAGARAVWAHALREYADAEVITALDAVKVAHPEFPPNLPQFLALCRAAKPREVYKPEQPALGMSQQLRSEYAARARAVNEKYAQRAIDRKTGYVELECTLSGLKQAIANAVACAGGDEVAELLRLDRMYPEAVAA